MRDRVHWKMMIVIYFILISKTDKSSITGNKDFAHTNLYQ